MQRSDSWLHFALGAVTALTSPYVAAAYIGTQASRTPHYDANGCPNTIIQGAEYALGYFGVLLLYQTFTPLSY